MRGLHPAKLSSYIGLMQEGSPRPRHKVYGGIAASVALHAVIAGIILVQLPPADIIAPEEETVSVEMVPPPEEAQPSEEEQALTVPEMTPSEPEPQPQSPAEEPPAEAETQAGEPPPPQQQQQASVEPPPPPAAPASTETQQAEPEPPAGAEETAEQPAADDQDQAETAQAGDEETSEEDAGRGQPLPVLKPVFEYGDEASGSGIARSGNASEGEEAEQTETAETPAEEAAADAEQTAEAEVAGEGEAEPAAPNLPDDIETPAVDIADAAPLPSSEEEGADGTQTELAAEPKPEASDEQAKPEDSQAEKATADPAEDEPPRPARRLFSEQDTGAQVARTASGNVPRDIRAGQLCSTELTEQLRHGAQRFNPDIVPAFKLPEGTVLDVRQAAFRANSQWYDIRFRCEVNANATRVVSFGLDIGQAVPRSEWRARRFPEF